MTQPTLLTLTPTQNIRAAVAGRSRAFVTTVARAAADAVDADTEGGGGGAVDAVTARSVFLSNLPYRVDADGIARAVAEAGGGDDAEVELFMRDGRPSGLALVRLASPEAAERAIAALDGTDLGGRTVFARAARPPAARAPRRDDGEGRGYGRRDDRGYGRRDDRGGERGGERRERRFDRGDRGDRGDGGRSERRRGPKLIVSGLPGDAAWQDIKDAVADTGNEAGFVFMRGPREGGNGSSTAFVYMADVAAAESAAAAINGREFGGRPVRARADPGEPDE